MVGFTSIISKLKPIKVIVAGDLMLDAYILGHTKRISPEAPVPIMVVDHEKELPGGAGNVMLNLHSMGVKVEAIGRVGDDSNGISLLKYLCEEGIGTQGIMFQSDYNTPVKKRIIANSQQMMRLDYEIIKSLPKYLEDEIIVSLPEIFRDAKALAISDYGKGFLSDSLLKSLIDYANQMQIPIIVDPKGTNFSKYNHATVLKPNLSEAYASVGVDDQTPLEKVVELIFARVHVDKVMITKSEKGISLFTRDEEELYFPAKSKEVKDVTGAGDTVLAMFTHAIASGLDYFNACILSNLAAGIAIEKMGCARITPGELARRLLEIDSSNKIIGHEDISFIRSALVDRQYKILSVCSEQGLSTLLIQTIFSLSNSEEDLLIYIRDGQSDINFIEVLSALKQIDYIIAHQDALEQIITILNPSNIYYFENNMLYHGTRENLKGTIGAGHQ